MQAEKIQKQTRMNSISVEMAWWKSLYLLKHRDIINKLWNVN